MRLWVLVAGAVVVVTWSSCESDPELLARGAEALRMVRRRNRPSVGHRIYGGTLADLKMFPLAAFACIYGRACSSTVVHRYFVLLSKWCTEARPEDGIIMAGGTEFTTVQDLTPVEVQIRQIQRWWIHEWTHDIWHDITVAKLFTPFRLNEYVGVYPIVTDQTWGPNKLNCIMLGFGEAVEGDRQHLLHWMKMEMVNYEKCQEVVLVYGIPIGENAFCSVKVDKVSMCEGDSGGPVICRGMLYGTNSDKVPRGRVLIRQCGERVLCNYYMFMGYYRPWIESLMQNYTPVGSDVNDQQQPTWSPPSTEHPDCGPQHRGPCNKSRETTSAASREHFGRHLIGTFLILSLALHK